jgi:NADH-quinone oxidoreductase subunit H
MITTSFLMSILFFGGWSLFGLENALDDPIASALLRFAILGGKMVAFVGLFLLVRWTIPRFRFDQLMSLAWKVMIPLALLNLFAAMCIRQFDVTPWAMTGVSALLFILAGLLAAYNGTSDNTPRKLKKPLPPGVQPGVTYAAQ